MDRKANQEKALAAYREKQKRIATLLSKIQDKLARHAGPVVCRGHVGDLGHVEELLNQIDTFTFATLLYSATNDLLVVQRALGHRDISSTQIYTHLVDGRLEEALERI